MDTTPSATETRRLRRDAIIHADWMQAAICELALDGEVDVEEHIQLSDAEAARLAGMTRVEALRICAAALDVAAAHLPIAA